MRMLTWNLASVSVVCAVLGAAAGAGWAMRTPDAYISTAVLKVSDDGQAGFLDRLQQAQVRVLSRGALSEVIAREDLYRDERQRLPMEEVIEAARNKHIRITPIAEAHGLNPGRVSAFAISFEYPDRAMAQKVTRHLTDKFVATVPSIQVIDPPSLPQKPARPNWLSFMAAGLALGVGAGWLLFGIRRWPIVAVSGAAAAAAALVIAPLMYDRYVSTAVLQIDPPSSGVVQAALDDAVLQKIILKPSLDLYKKERAKQPIAEVIRHMREKDLRIAEQRFRGKTAIAVSFWHKGDPAKSQAVVRELVSTILEVNVSEARKRGPAAQSLSVVAPANLPTRPVAPHRPIVLFTGLTVGLVLGIVVTWVRRLRTAPMAA